MTIIFFEPFLKQLTDSVNSSFAIEDQEKNALSARFNFEIKVNILSIFCAKIAKSSNNFRDALEKLVT